MAGKTKYIWSAAKRRYVHRESGRVVAKAELEQAVREIAAYSRVRLAVLAEKVRLGRIKSLGTWKIAMAREIKNGHLGMAMMAAGGTEQMTPKVYHKAEQIVERQLGWLDRFARQVESGRQAIGDGFIERSARYGDALATTYQNVTRVALGDVTIEECRVLGGRDHCDTCKEQAGLGWQPRGTLRDIGDSECGPNCNCTFRMRQQGEERLAQAA